MSYTGTDALKKFNDTLNEYALQSKKNAAEIVIQKGEQLILGMSGSFDGAYQRFERLAPKRGSIFQERIGLIRREGIFVKGRAASAASSILKGSKSGLFNISGGDGSALRITPIYIGTKGKKKGLRIYGKAKNKELAGASLKKDLGGIVLNSQALKAAYELKYREAARRYSAVAFLDKFYKKFCGMLRRKYGGSGSKRRYTQTGKEYVNYANKSGTSLSHAIANFQDGGAEFRLRVFTSTMKKPGARRILDRVLSDVTKDMRQYINRKQAEAAQKAGLKK